jgi:wyosine [tRNA(Phe)-imidazoG37] synthetase (radical SAM superfamily)
MIAFGPVPSRRLGRSLGINNIPPKNCPYACVYCQVGRTLHMRLDRQAFYNPEQVFQDVRDKLEGARQAGETIDYLTFVPDGEPTLDVNLGREIALLRPLGIPIAVISNASLIWREDVREELTTADWVSLKMDAVEEGTWRQVNRPQGTLRLDAILDGALTFASAFGGHLVTETMLVEGINDSAEHLSEVARFLARLKPETAYLSIPTRPPAEAWVRPPAEATINRAYQIFSEKVDRVEYLIGYEGNAFAFTGDVEDDLLSITAVHPMREDAVDVFLARAGADWEVVRDLVTQGELIEAKYGGYQFYLRTLRRRGASQG